MHPRLPMQKDSAVMRELVDKHFADNWVVCWAPGFLAHLPVRWSGFKAASSALNSIISPSTATVLATSSQASMLTLLVEVQVKCCTPTLVLNCGCCQGMLSQHDALHSMITA